MKCQTCQRIVTQAEADLGSKILLESGLDDSNTTCPECANAEAEASTLAYLVEDDTGTPYHGGIDPAGR